MDISLSFLNNPTTVLHTAKCSTSPGAMWEEDNNSTLNSSIMAGGRTYPPASLFTNPMHDPIQTRPNVLRSTLPTTAANISTDESGTAPQPEKRRPSFAIALPTSTFSVAAFAEAWEHDDNDNDNEDGMIEHECADFVEDRRHPSTSSRTAPGRGGKVKSTGALERKANTTYISGEVVVGKEAKGDTRVRGYLPLARQSLIGVSSSFTMVMFTYRGDAVDDMDIGDKAGDVGVSPNRLTNPPSSWLVNVNK